MRPPGADTDTDTDTDPGAHRRVCLGLNGHSRVVYAVYALNSLDTEDPVYAVYAMSLPDPTGSIHREERRVHTAPKKLSEFA